MTNKIVSNARIEESAELAHILIEGDKIVTITPDKPGDVAEEIDARGNLVLPGLINIHMHLDKSGLAETISNRSGTLAEAREKMREAKAGFRKEDIKARARKTVLRAVQDGVTAIRTHVDIDPSIGLRGLEAILELREDLKHVVHIQIVAFPQEGISEEPGTEDLMREAMAMGADVVGGHLSIAHDFREHSARVFEMATEFDRDVDIHVDIDIDRDYSKTTLDRDGKEYPDGLGVVAMAKETARRGYGGRVAASHLCALDALPPSVAENVIALMAQSGVSAIALPPGNLYTHGRADPQDVRRGVTRVRALLARGVRVSFGTDNTRDPFNPLGNTNMIHNAILTAYACHMATAEDFRTTLKLCTVNAADIMNLPGYGLKEGMFADMVVLDAPSAEEALANQATVTHVFKRGRLVATNEIQRNLYLG